MAGPLNLEIKETHLACPYFMPIAKLENGNWQHPSRLPLGCGWTGHCTAPGHENEIPTQEVLESSCNLGYATSCGWAPSERAWDSVRFAITAPATADRKVGCCESHLPTRILRVAYVYERDHRPAGSGYLEYEIEKCAWVRHHDDPRVQKMAECFLDSYMRKKH